MVSNDKFLLKTSYATQHWIYTKLQQLSSKISISLFNLYVPVNFFDFFLCWNTLSDYMELHSPTNIMVAGDLNIILNHKEKCGGNRGKDPLQGVVESLIQSNDLLDLKLKKGHFTWTNNIVGVS